VIPVSTALAASGVVVPFTNTVDPGFGSSCGTMGNEQRQFKAPDEQIYVVQFHRVCWTWFSSKKVDKMTLAKKLLCESYDRPMYLNTEIKDSIELEPEDEVESEGDIDETAQLESTQHQAGISQCA
jgi:hypothetical protein